MRARKDIRTSVRCPFAFTLTVTHITSARTRPRATIAQAIPGSTPWRPVDGGNIGARPRGPHVLVARHAGTFPHLCEVLGLVLVRRRRDGGVLVVAVDLVVEKGLRRRRTRFRFLPFDRALQILVRPKTENGKSVDHILLEYGLFIPFLAIRRPRRFRTARRFIPVVTTLASQCLLLHPRSSFTAPRSRSPHFGFAFHGDNAANLSPARA